MILWRLTVMSIGATALASFLVSIGAYLAIVLMR